MKTKLLWPLGLTVALTAASAMPAFAGSCSGVTVVTDPAGDETIDTGEGAAVPVPDAAADILSLALSEPSGKLAFAYKMSDLSSIPPNHAWIVRFNTDTPPDNGDDDYFVAMVTDVDGFTNFVYGTDGFTAGAPAEPRQFRPAGEITGSIAADGTITMAVDKSKIPGLDATSVYGILPTTRVVSGLNTGAEPFFTNASNETILDQTDVPDDYALGSCESDKSGLLGLGAFQPLALLVLGLMSLFGINKRRVS